MKKIANKNSTPIKRKTRIKNRSTYCVNDYLSSQQGMFFYRQVPLSETTAELLAEEWVESSRNEKEGLTMGRFCKQKGIYPGTMAVWCKKFPVLHAAREIVRGFIADNREVGAIKKEFDFKSIAHNQHQYSIEWGKADKHHAELRKKDETALEASNFKIIMQPDEKTDEVKDKK
jgi:hypothetical protein